MSSEVIPNNIAAKILNMRYQTMINNMETGVLDIGWVKPKDKKKRSGKATCHVYRAKLAKHLGRDPDFVWPEELEDENGDKS